MAETKKAVLMMHTDQAQGELWKTALATQQLDVIWENISLDLVQYLEKCDRHELPDLLIMDMAIKSPSSETLQSSSVCQWLIKQKAPTKVVLFNPRQEKIKDMLITTLDINEPKANSKSETKNNSKPNQKSDGGEVVMYRGVRIRR